MALPPLLTLQNIHLTFGGTPLLEGADLSVSPNERLCLIGRNGCGKSTLLKVAAGMIEPDSGKRFFQPGTTVQYLPQEPDLTEFETTLDYVEAGLSPSNDVYRAQYLIEQLGLTGKEDTKHLSGGESRRAALARVLAPSPDILLLDEPTNHLDLPVIEWLEEELKSLRSALVLISHDRRFLETLSRSTVWIDRGQSRTLNQGFAHFESWRDELLEQEELERHKLDRKIHAEEQWVIYGVTARRKRNVRRMANLHELRQKRKDHRHVAGKVQVTKASESDVSGKMVAEAKNISKSYDGVDIIKDLSLKIARGDKVGIVGPNGSGKTTLINLLTGLIEPDEGSIRLGTTLQMVTLDQKRESLNPDWSLKDALTGGGGNIVDIPGNPKHVVSYMKDFLFSPEQANTPITALSGGERGRLMLARALAKPSNLLVLDEPTNDLDLETLDLLQELLAEYEGTVLLVSHDRDFLDRIVTSTLAYEGDANWIEYAGGYSDMISQRGVGVQAKDAQKEKEVKPKAKQQEVSRTTTSPQKQKLSYKEKYALETLPGEIDKIQSDIASLEEKMANPDFYTKDPEGFQKATKELDALRTQLDDSEERWLELEMLKEELGLS